MEGLCIVNNVKKYFCSRIEVDGNVFFTSINGSDNFTFEPWMMTDNVNDISLAIPIAICFGTFVGFCVFIGFCVLDK